MNKKITFLQEILYLDYFHPFRYLIIIEVEHGKPKSTMTVKIPDPHPEFPSDPYLYN